jgi:hypothetical protein
MTDPHAPATDEVLAGARWRASTFTSGGECVEIAELGDHVAVRNSNHPAAGTVFLTPGEMAAFVSSVKAGELDRHARR